MADVVGSNITSLRDPWEQHLVAFVGIFQHETVEPSPQMVLCSGFVMEIVGLWFWIFPGHLVTEIRAAEGQGFSLTHTWLLSFVKPQDELIAFNWSGSEPHTIDEDGLDYGVIQLQPYYVSHLKAAKIVPIYPSRIASRGDVADRYFLIGVHAESSSIVQAQDEDRLRLAHPVLELTRMEDEDGIGSFWRLIFSAAEELKVVKVDDKPVTSIKGMSGGPIFGLSDLGEGKRGYRLFGLQSSWTKQNKVLRACPLDLLAGWLTRVVNEAKQAAEEAPEG